MSCITRLRKKILICCGIRIRIARKQIQIKALVLQLYDSQKIVSLKNFDHRYRYQYSIVGNRQ